MMRGQVTETGGSGGIAPSELALAAMVFAVAGLAGCGGPIVHARPDAATLIPRVSAIVAMAPRLGFGKGSEQRRAARRTGDTLIRATGGRAILAEELPSTEPELIADGVRALGENPVEVLTFSVVAARADRAETFTIPAQGGVFYSTHRYADYTVRLDVRRADGRDVIGSVETFTTAFANAPDVDADGHAVGLQRAIDDAIAEAMKRFAPTLTTRALAPTIVELPARTEEASLTGALAAVDKLRRLQSLYPERSSEDLAALASSNARFLIVEPGSLAALGLASGDLVSGLVGRSLGSRAALARTLARGEKPAMSIDRASGRFLVGQTLVARAH